MGLFRALPAMTANRISQSEHGSERARRRAAAQLQLGCLDVGDEVPFRYHWPRHVELRVNNMQVGGWVW